MDYKVKLKPYLPIIYFCLFLSLFLIAFYRGNSIVLKSEKEFKTSKSSSEAIATSYSLKEIDAKTGLLRWVLTAKDGVTGANLKSVIINNITAKVYNGRKIAYKLFAPKGRADSKTKEIFLFGGVVTESANGDFKLLSSTVNIDGNASINTPESFHLILMGKGDIYGTEAKVNDDQTEIAIKSLDKADMENILLSGSNVKINRDDKGDLLSANILNGGKIILKKVDNNSLTANTIKWLKDGSVEALSKVVYTSKDSTLTANKLTMKGDGKIYASNHVKIIYGDTICTGDKLTFEDKSNIIISGSPEAIQNGKVINADKILYNTKSGKVEALGNVRITSKTNA